MNQLDRLFAVEKRRDIQQNITASRYQNFEANSFKNSLFLSECRALKGNFEYSMTRYVIKY